MVEKEPRINPTAGHGGRARASFRVVAFQAEPHLSYGAMRPVQPGNLPMGGGRVRPGSVVGGGLTGTAVGAVAELVTEW